MHLGLFRQAFAANDHFVFRVHLVAALEEHVELGRESDKYAVVGVVGLDTQQHRAAQNGAAYVYETRIAVVSIGLHENNVKFLILSYTKQRSINIVADFFFSQLNDYLKTKHLRKVVFESLRNVHQVLFKPLFKHFIHNLTFLQYFF